MKIAVYLKFNRASASALRSLAFWWQVFNQPAYDVFILSDLEPQALSQLLFAHQRDRVIASAMPYREQIASFLVPKWVNAGAAHLTTFGHAQSLGYDFFWNIDADDTLFFCPTGEIASLLGDIEAFAKAQGVDCFSLDMYQTMQRHWSFGVTFTSLERADYLGLISSIGPDAIAQAYPAKWGGQPAIVDGAVRFYPGYCGNLDWTFTYMRDQEMIDARSFYIEGLYFAHLHVHHYDAAGLLMNGVYHWEAGKLWYNDIAPDCVRFLPRPQPALEGAARAQVG